jgi:hypothetical protein
MFKDERDSRLGQRGGEFSRQPDPNPLQIRAACAVIRMGWSEAERISRAQFSEYRWQAPHCPADLREMLNGSS